MEADEAGGECTYFEAGREHLAEDIRHVVHGLELHLSYILPYARARLRTRPDATCGNVEGMGGDDAVSALKASTALLKASGMLVAI